MLVSHPPQEVHDLLTVQFYSQLYILAELSREKRAQRSTMGKKKGKLPIRENLVIT